MANKFIDSIKFFMQAQNYGKRTEETYIYWIKYFIRYHPMKHPQDMGSNEIEQFLSFLAVERNCSISTQKTALNALSFLYTRFLNFETIDFSAFIPLPYCTAYKRSKIAQS